jgi:hypothetical protein
MFSLYRNKKNGKKIYYKSFLSLPAFARRMIRLRQKIIYNQEFASKWITLTYKDKYLYSDYKDDIAKFIKNLKYHIHTNLEKFSPNYNDSLFSSSNTLEYIWRFETNSKGNRKFNPHFHLIANVKPFIHSNYIEKIWKKGFVHVNDIHNKSELNKYISKYMSKDMEKTVVETISCSTCVNKHCIDAGLIHAELTSKNTLKKTNYPGGCENYIGRLKSWASSRGYKKPKSEWRYVMSGSESEMLKEVYSDKAPMIDYKGLGVIFKTLIEYL